MWLQAEVPSTFTFLPVVIFKSFPVEIEYSDNVGTENENRILTQSLSPQRLLVIILLAESSSVLNMKSNSHHQGKLKTLDQLNIYQLQQHIFEETVSNHISINLVFRSCDTICLIQVCFLASGYL